MTAKISILMPSIRPHLLEGVYNSIAESCHETWELVLVSPYPLPESLKDKPNVLYIYDAGTPIRARQRGLIAANGEFICYAADDVLFYPNSLDIAYNTLKDKPYTTIVLGKYREGSEDNPFMDSDSYYFLMTHDFLKPVMHNFPRSYKLLNTGLISKRLMMEIGGFDCKFEACAMACVDLSIRLQNHGAEIIIQDEPIFHSTHLPHGQGDHHPIHLAQVAHDQPLFLNIYSDERSKYRDVIDVNNWENAEKWWVRRFGVEESACTHELKDAVLVAGRHVCWKCGEVDP